MGTREWDLSIRFCGTQFSSSQVPQKSRLTLSWQDSMGRPEGNSAFGVVGHREEGPGVYPLASAILTLTGLSWCHGIWLSLYSGCHPPPPRSHGTAIFCTTTLPTKNGGRGITQAFD